MSLSIIILAAGQGTRMKSTLPKMRKFLTDLFTPVTIDHVDSTNIKPGCSNIDMFQQGPARKWMQNFWQAGLHASTLSRGEYYNGQGHY